MNISINGVTKVYSAPISLYEISKDYEQSFASPIVAALVNGHEKSLWYTVEQDVKIEWIEMQSTIGIRVYARSLLFVLQISLNRLGITNMFDVRGHLANSFYCTLRLEAPVDINLIHIIEKNMRDIINQNALIEYHQADKMQACEYLNNCNENIEFLQLIEHLQQPTISYYKCLDNVNYFFSPLVPMTGYLQTFALTSYRGGILLQFPAREDIHTIQPYVDRPALATIYSEAEEWAKYLECATLGDLNNKITTNEFEDIMYISEALQEKKIVQIADMISTQAAQKQLILIAGPSSSGKTTFANRLRIQLIVNGIKPLTVSVDDYFVPREFTPRLPDGSYDFESIETVDLALFNSDLQKILRGDTVQLPTFDFETGSRHYSGKSITLQAGQPVIIEGIHCMNDRLTERIPAEQKFKIYVSAITGVAFNEYNRISTTDCRLLRRMVRDYQFRGHTPAATLQLWPKVRAGEEKNIFPFQETAQVMFNTSLLYELPILKKYVEPLLKIIPPDDPGYSEACRLLNLLQHIKPSPTIEILPNSLLREFIGKTKC